MSLKCILRVFIVSVCKVIYVCWNACYSFQEMYNLHFEYAKEVLVLIFWRLHIGVGYQMFNHNKQPAVLNKLLNNYSIKYVHRSKESSVVPSLDLHKY